MSDQKIRTILIEHQEIVRLGMRLTLQSLPGVLILAEFADGALAVQNCCTLDPDLILMNLGLPGFDALAAIAELKQSTAAKVIIVTSHDRDEEVLAALSGGADAYCLTGLSPAHLVRVLECVMGGGLWLDAKAARAVVNSWRQGAKKTANHPAALSDRRLSGRELQVLTLVVEGFTNQQIAQRLNVSAETVKTHLRRVMDKLSVSDRTQAAVKGLNHGLIDLAALNPSTTGVDGPAVKFARLND